MAQARLRLAPNSLLLLRFWVKQLQTQAGVCPGSVMLYVEGRVSLGLRGWKLPCSTDRGRWVHVFWKVPTDGAYFKNIANKIITLNNFECLWVHLRPDASNSG